ncbi:MULTISPECIES: mechanosensitive ion channel family protein [Halococcus]|uniref:Mechanosensitive ion channel protein MscS n=1 Tax=Halococcus salifodinae DSM 8989 TaxID=1227456 RepID=M0NBL8_9EURY|nr:MULTISPECIES: mechanosensitive ion channel family protein [Halococcus]EMA55261.1 mechanosensitive ion channel protein MscS [Halococcus salifodinae DSM 8989]
MGSILLQQGIPTSPGGIVDQYGPALIEVAAKAALFVVAFVAIYAIGRFVLVRLVKGALGARGFDPKVVGLGGTVARALALFAALSLAATMAGFGTVLAAFATLLGALSLALGFAAQDLLANFAAGIFILKDDPFGIGDWIEWPSGDGTKSGVVQDIGLRVTKLKTFDNELITVPNSELADNAVTNPVADDQLRIPFTFGIGYEDDIEQAKEIIVQEAATVDRLKGEPEPDVILTELADSYVGLTARAHIDDPSRGKYVKALSAWVQAVKERFDAEGIDMPYPYTELTGGIDIENMDDADLARADD